MAVNSLVFLSYAPACLCYINTLHVLRGPFIVCLWPYVGVDTLRGLRQLARCESTRHPRIANDKAHPLQRAGSSLRPPPRRVLSKWDCEPRHGAGGGGDVQSRAQWVTEAGGWILPLRRLNHLPRVAGAEIDVPVVQMSNTSRRSMEQKTSKNSMLIYWSYSLHRKFIVLFA